MPDIWISRNWNGPLKSRIVTLKMAYGEITASFFASHIKFSAGDGTQAEVSKLEIALSETFDNQFRRINPLPKVLSTKQVNICMFHARLAEKGEKENITSITPLNSNYAGRQSVQLVYFSLFNLSCLSNPKASALHLLYFLFFLLPASKIIRISFSATCKHICRVICLKR